MMMMMMIVVMLKMTIWRKMRSISINNMIPKMMMVMMIKNDEEEVQSLKLAWDSDWYEVLATSMVLYINNDDYYTDD